MGKKNEKMFVIRGFDFLSEIITQPTGLIEHLDTFEEHVEKTKEAAIIKMLSISYLSDSIVFNENVEDTLHLINFKISIDSIDKLEIKDMKSEIREIMMRWSEKSRIKNLRGFRVSAIRTPTYIYNIDNTTINFEVILSNTIIYSYSKFNADSRSDEHINSDLMNLKKMLKKRIPLFSKLHYIHSNIGSGSIYRNDKN